MSEPAVAQVFAHREVVNPPGGEQLLLQYSIEVGAYLADWCQFVQSLVPTDEVNGVVA